MDIIDRIDQLLKENDIRKNFKYIPKENALKILEYIEQSTPEDKILIETIKQYIKRDWSIGNPTLLEQFYRVLMFYGILEGNVQRKSILENRGKTIVKKFVIIENQKHIRKLLEIDAR
jgi:hypothetical protein